MSKETKVAITFAGFALLLAFRDVATELFLSTQTATKAKTLWLSFMVCGTILGLSCIRLLVTGRSGLLKKLRTPGALRKAALLGLLSGGIYFGIFFIIGQLGAGVAALIDAGLIPLATAIVGAVMFKEKLTTNFFGACAVYILGITVLMVTRNEFIPLWLLGVAVLPPVASALSDGQTKWLLDKNNAGLTRDELLIVRFSPAVLVLYVLASWASGSLMPQIDAPFKTLAVAVTGGWIPLMLLCTGLGMAGMKKLAAWEFTIPAATFLGTLHLHVENVGVPMLGALLILSGIVISEWKLISRFSLRKKVTAKSATSMADAEVI
jgi:drug/metabolite transporter (DMT)-like permease